MLTITEYEAALAPYLVSLREDEMSEKTISTYSSALASFHSFITCRGVDIIVKETVINFKDMLLKDYSLSTARLYVTLLNSFLKSRGYDGLCVKGITKGAISSLDEVVAIKEYQALLMHAEKQNTGRLYAILRTLAATGLRIDELKYLTVGAVKSGMVAVHLKRKYRVVVIHEALRKLLLDYCREEEVKAGIIFHGRNPEKLIDKSYLWRELKKLAAKAGVNPKKVHAHSFRHLFAKTFIAKGNSITDLADILGHTSLETTRIYTRTSTAEKKARIARLGL